MFFSVAEIALKWPDKMLNSVGACCHAERSDKPRSASGRIKQEESERDSSLRSE